LAPAITTDLVLNALNWQRGNVPCGVVGTCIGFLALAVTPISTRLWLDLGLTSVLGTMLFYDLGGLIWSQD
jgi:hypothetical protein